MKRPIDIKLIYARVLELTTLPSGAEKKGMLGVVVVFFLALLVAKAASAIWQSDRASLHDVYFELALLYTTLVLSEAILSRLVRRPRVRRKSAPSLQHILNFADFWGLGLRKRIKACAGEFDVEVNRLHKEKRYRMAKWNVVLAWGFAIWYVLRGPYDLVKGALVKALKGL